MSTERVKDTIRKLLDLAANDAASEGEVNNAIRFARKLLMQHQLSEEDCREQTESPELKAARAACGRFDSQGGTAKRTYWENSLSLFCCRFVGGVKVYCEPGVRRSAAGIVQLDKRGVARNAMFYRFYGVAEDAAFAQRTFDDLTTVVASMARLKWGGVFRGPGREYCEGFVDGLCGQLRQAEAEQNQSESRALVIRRDALMAAKESRAVEWIKEQGVTLRRTGFSGGIWDDEARQDGRRDGAKTKVDGKPVKIGCDSQLRLGSN